MAGCKLQTRGQLLLEPGSARVRCWKGLSGSAGRMAGTKPFSLLPSQVSFMPSLNPARFHQSMEKRNLQQYVSNSDLGLFKASEKSFSSVQSLSRVRLFAPHESQQARPLYPSPTPRVHSNSCVTSW